VEFGDEFNLNTTAQRYLSYSKSASGMFPGFSKYFKKELRTAVNHEMVLSKFRCGID
jgi:ferritin